MRGGTSGNARGWRWQCRQRFFTGGRADFDRSARPAPIPPAVPESASPYGGYVPGGYDSGRTRTMASHSGRAASAGHRNMPVAVRPMFSAVAVVQIRGCCLAAPCNHPICDSGEVTAPGVVTMPQGLDGWCAECHSDLPNFCRLAMQVPPTLAEDRRARGRSLRDQSAAPLRRLYRHRQRGQCRRLCQSRPWERGSGSVRRLLLQVRWGSCLRLARSGHWQFANEDRLAGQRSALSEGRSRALNMPRLLPTPTGQVIPRAVRTAPRRSRRAGSGWHAPSFSPVSGGRYTRIIQKRTRISTPVEMPIPMSRGKR